VTVYRRGVLPISIPEQEPQFAAPHANAISGLNSTPVKDYDWVGAAVSWNGTSDYGALTGGVHADWRLVAWDDTPNNEKSAPKPTNVTFESDATCSGGVFLRATTRREVWKGQAFSGVQMECVSGTSMTFGNGADFFVECRLRWTGYEGCWPGPWMIQYPGAPYETEIDIMETPNTRQPYTSLHPYGWADPGGGQVHIGHSYAASNDGQWHRYGLRITATEVRRFYDNVQIASMTNATYAAQFRNESMFFKFQHHAGGNWPDDDLGLARGTTPRANVVFPNHFDCDWFRIYTP
jgi:hypothetical protein